MPAFFCGSVDYIYTRVYILYISLRIQWGNGTTTNRRTMMSILIAPVSLQTRNPRGHACVFTMHFPCLFRAQSIPLTSFMYENCYEDPSLYIHIHAELNKTNKKVKRPIPPTFWVGSHAKQRKGTKTKGGQTDTLL